jgi:hypothetical protein
MKKLPPPVEDVILKFTALFLFTTQSFFQLFNSAVHCRVRIVDDPLSFLSLSQRQSEAVYLHNGKGNPFNEYLWMVGEWYMQRGTAMWIQ